MAYQVRGTDTDGNAVLAPQVPVSFQSLEPFVATSNILLVVDSTWSGNVTSIAPFYKTALEDLNLPYDFWDTSPRGYVDLGTLKRYVNKVVVWGVPYFGLLTSSQAQDNLASYLDSGGRLFISGQDVGALIRQTSFYSNYLHASYVQTGVDLYALDGASGDPISGGVRLEISGGDGARNQFSADEIDPIAPAVAIWSYDALATTPLAQLQASEESAQEARLELLARERADEDGVPPFGPDPNSGLLLQEEVSTWEVGPQAITGSGTGALRVDTGNYRVVY